MSLRRRSLLAGAAWPLLGCDQATAPLEGRFNGVSHERGHLLRERRASSSPVATHRTGVVIAGGGVAGLAAARALRQRGMDDFVVLELEDSAGGNSRAGLVGGLSCPLGAHYLPVPGDDAVEVQDLLEELGLRQRVAGRWQYDERHLCHSPQERLFFNGQWQEGLLPLQGVTADTLAQYRRFSARVDSIARAARFAIPVSRMRWTPALAELDALTFANWLAREGLSDPHLRWYLDYCCRDDYGADSATVSAWAGLHYFASRHGFHLPGEGTGGRDAVLTWPEGNGWLVHRLATPLGQRLRPAQVVTRIAAVRHGVEVDVLHPADGQTHRWQANQCIVALPLHVAVRVVENPPESLRQAAARTPHSPWLVANVHLAQPLDDRGGAAPAWDNVVYGAQGLGYVDASHQRLTPLRGATVLTWYLAPGAGPEQRARLLAQPWQHGWQLMQADLAAPHPELASKARRVEITRYGHAMAVPVPGAGTDPARAALSAPGAGGRRLHFAHSDLSGYSVFEEAFSHGHRAARQLQLS